MSLVERRRVTPVTPMRAFSSGMVTRVSTSSGAKPGASVSRVTVGLVRSGSTSTGSSSVFLTPRTSSTRAATITRARWARENRMRWLSMEAVVSCWLVAVGAFQFPDAGVGGGDLDAADDEEDDGDAGEEGEREDEAGVGGGMFSWPSSACSAAAICSVSWGCRPRCAGGRGRHRGRP